MINPPIEPHNGDDLSATWLRSLLRYVRATRPIAGPGLKQRVTPNGTHLSCDVSSGRGGKTRADLTCFRIAKLEPVRSESGEITQIDVALDNLYYRIAGKTYLLEPPEEEESGGSSQESEESTDPSVPTPDPFYHVSSDMHKFILGLKLDISGQLDKGEEPPAEVEVYPSIEELRAAENGRDAYVFPLYLFEDWAVKVDLRTAPGLIMTEYDAPSVVESEEEEEEE